MRLKSKTTRELMQEGIETWGYDIGEHSYGAPGVWSLGHGALRIGRFCSIAPAVEILMMGGDHNPDCPTTFPLQSFRPVERPPGSQKGPRHVFIGNDVWLGHGCAIMADVTIGDGAIIGARAVVTRDVGPYEIVAGSPARLIRKRFTDAQIETLLKIRWWDWPIEKVDAFAPLLLQPDIEAFIEAALADRAPAAKTPAAQGDPDQ
jgi:acetyltransferase-like isoleucine patch superfamily enzyme